MRRYVFALAVTAALSLTGCGQRSATAEIRDAIQTFGASVADGQGERACGLMTDAARRGVVRDNAGLGATRCEQVIAMVPRVATAGQRREMRSLEVVRVELRGGRATALRGGSVLTDGDRVKLRRVGGHWSIDYAA